MAPGVPTKVIGATSGLAAFAVAVIAGLGAANPAEVILLRALIAMFVCNLVGCVAGAIGERTIAEALTLYKRAHPAPDQKTDSGGTNSRAEPALEV